MRSRLIVLLFLVACGDDDSVAGHDASTSDGGGGGPIDAGAVACISGLQSIVLGPADQVVALDGNDPAAPLTFTAEGMFGDGHSEALAVGSLAWSVSRADATPPGTIDAGVLHPYPFSGGIVTVAAGDGCVTGDTTVVFSLDVTLGEPTDPADWTGTAVTEGGPTIVYPSDQTRFPRNIYRTLFQWRTQGFTEFRLVFEGPGASVTVYTDGAHPLCADKTPAAGCFEADELTWRFLAGSNAGATVTWVVDALDRSTPTPTIRRSPAITIGFSRQDVTGAVFYWSTTSAGVRRANVVDAVPEDYITGKPGTQYTSPDDQVKCVACHVVSRSGKYMAAPVQAQSGDSLWILEVTDTAPPSPLVKTVQDTRGHGFATISPDDAFVVAAWKGAMWMVDRATGDYLADLPLGTMKGTHPDWSPDGTELVFATGDGDAPGGASIAVIPYLGGTTWGAPALRVQAAADRTNLFPMFSPAGDWIAFSRGKGGHDDRQAQLYLVAAAGGTPIELVSANRMVSNVLGDGQSSNTQPTWAPPPADPDLPDYQWVAFNSMREYGVVRPAGTQQIWVAAIDLDAAAAGDDASFPAFRLQFQGLDEDNHRAFWTRDVRDPTPEPDAGPGSDARTCLVEGETCDPVYDCCADGRVCDTNDDGKTYVCMSIE